MDKLKAASCFSCCFRGPAEDDDSAHAPPTASLVRTSTDWVRSRALDLPDRCRSVVARIGRSHRRRDFGYDPLSYALNFDDGADLDGNADPSSIEDFRYRTFSSRLPASPPDEHPPRRV